MNQKHPYRATILPVPEGTHRPLWSVMIPTYNCANYLRETLASVLAQDLGAEIMQIEVIDDHSTKDDPEAVVRELAGDRVSFYRQPENVGYIKNFETCLQRSRGQLIHLLHGDDCVKQSFYRKLQRGFEEKPEIGAAFCRHIHMDEQGNWIWTSCLEQSESGILDNWLERIAVMQLIQTPSIVVRRDVYEQLGLFDNRMSCWGEDWEMWVRIAVHYPVWYEVEALALYRRGSTSLTGQSVRTGKNIQDFRQAVDIVREYLPSESASKLSRTALRNYAFYAIDSAREFISKGDSYGAINQLREALKCHLSIATVKSSIKLIIENIHLMILSRLGWTHSANS
ncbi:MAG: glycosyltransferase family 2 protein [Dolichospermum sp. DET50]|nr:glycosyltransferase family 2 protein [Dolichospermum sp. DET66]MBS3032034.1 glycosyltransferase family 2 protein [Dolichospermum sp. DET67]MBS3037243.1 glycosyltransferase family 2 protein [Dolichospermum sp. DET50]QSX69231.1 MAG: glycosyltransferase family 2 protein [Dolichospermum sp. DET69]